MASLNTLRTKFGIVLSIIIALALLAFILSLKTEMGFSGNDPRVGVIDGEKINYSEYYETYERVRSQSGTVDSDEQQSAMLANAAWQQLFSKYVLDPGFERLGLRVTEPERMAMVSGEQPSQAFFNAFADPRTGSYNVAAVSQFLAQAETNSQAQAAWQALNEQARLERLFQKYMGLVRGGTYVNALEVANGVASANNTFSGRWAGKKYASMPDSLFTVSSSEMNEYYKSHKQMFKQQPSRTLSYVIFEVNPTDDDMLALEKQAKEVGAQLAASDEVRTFVRSNRNGRIAENYVSAAQLTDDEAEALTAGKQYGPVLKNNEWTMARVLDVKTAPDSLGIKHIVLPYTEESLADSLMGELRGGADFAELASRYSVYDATAANGGEVGVLPFSAFTGEFAEALAGAKSGDIVKIASGDAIQIMQVYRADKPSKHYQIAFNLIPQIDVFYDNLYTKEEMKMVNETKKMFHDPDIRVTATCARVPVFYCHSESVNIETEKKLSPKDCRLLLSQAPGVQVYDNPRALMYPHAAMCVGEDDTFVGRIREDDTVENGLNMWIVADNVRKGAALNAVQIAEELVKRDLVRVKDRDVFMK